MALAESQSGHDLPEAEVLILPEVATNLRVPEEAVRELVARDALPGQQIGGQWRFLKGAVVEWLRFGPHFRREFRMFPPPWMLDQSKPRQRTAQGLRCLQGCRRVSSPRVLPPGR